MSTTKSQPHTGATVSCKSTQPTIHLHGVNEHKLAALGWHRATRASYWAHPNVPDRLGDACVGTSTLLLKHNRIPNFFFATEMGYFFADELFEKICLICDRDDPDTAMQKLEEAAVPYDWTAGETRMLIQLKGSWAEMTSNYWEVQREVEEDDEDSETDEEAELSEEEKRIRYGDACAAWQLKVDFVAGKIGKEEYLWRIEEAMQRPEVVNAIATRSHPPVSVKTALARLT